MKKIISLILLTTLCITIVSCDTTSGKTDSIDNNDINNDVSNQEVYDNLEFLNDEQQTLFNSNIDLFNSMFYNTPHIFDIYNLSFVDNELIEKDSFTYFVTDLSFESFQTDMLKIFTQNFLDSNEVRVFNYDGRLAHINADGGFSIPNQVRYANISKSEEEISFSIISYFYRESNLDVENLEEASFVHEREITLIKESDLWKIDNIGERVYVE